MIDNDTIRVWVVGGYRTSDVHLNRWSDGGLGVDLGENVQLVFENPIHAVRWLEALVEHVATTLPKQEAAPATGWRSEDGE